jgi:hypothetical protein
MSTIGGSQHITRGQYIVSASSSAPDTNLALEYDGKTVKGLDVPSGETRWRESWKFSAREIFITNTSNDPDGIGGVIFPPVLQSLIDANHWGLNALSLRDRWHSMVGYVHGYNTWNEFPELAKGRTNKFRGFDPGSLMFMGATMSQLDDWYYEVTFEFMYSPNAWAGIPSTVTGVETRSAGWSDTLGFQPEIKASTFGNDSYEIYKNGWDYLEFHYLDKDQDIGDSDGKATLPVPVAYTLHQTQTYIPFGYLGIPQDPVFVPGIDANEKPAYDPRFANLPCVPAAERAGPYWETNTAFKKCLNVLPGAG